MDERNFYNFNMMNNNNLQETKVDNNDTKNLSSKLDKYNKSILSQKSSNNSTSQYNIENNFNKKNVTDKLNYNKYNLKTNNDNDIMNKIHSSETRPILLNSIKKEKKVNNSELIKENFGQFLKNTIYQNEHKGKQLNQKNPINDIFENEKVIINNLESELILKNDEIRILKKNFKEKVGLIENENKKIVNNLENQFNNVINNLNHNHIETINGLEIKTLKVKNEYDEILSKIYSNILNLKNNSVDIKKHDNIIQDLKTKSFVKIEEYKNNFDEKLRELINFFDKPDYRKLIHNINIYMKFKEKIDFTADDLNFIDNFNMTNQEYELWIDRLKLNLISAECDYINGVVDLENNYLNLYEKIKLQERDKYKIVENEINEKFGVSIYFKL